MCGRFHLKTPASDLAGRFDAETVGAWDAGPDFSPGQSVPLVRGEGRRRVLGAAFWGWPPPSASTGRRSRLAINARSETVSVQPAFRDAFAHRRAAIPAEAFYEWDRRGPGGRPRSPKGPPWTFSLKEGGPFALAAVWTRRKDPAGGAEGAACVILTTEANALVAPHHDRMPVILAPGDLDRWLGDAPPADLAGFLRPWEAETMTATPPAGPAGPVQLGWC